MTYKIIGFIISIFIFSLAAAAKASNDCLCLMLAILTAGFMSEGKG